MHAAILALVEGEPERMPIESEMDGSLPAIDANSMTYLDGERIYFRKAADRVETEIQKVHVDDVEITTSREEVLEKVVCDWYADLDAGWIGVSTGKADFLFEILATRHGVEAYEGAIDLDAFAEHLAETDAAGSWQTSRKKTLDDDGTSRVDINYHDSANLIEATRGHNVQLGFEYFWDDVRLRGTITRSGYVALYNSITEPVFGRWMKDEVVPFLTTEHRLKQKEERESDQPTKSQQKLGAEP